jgi:hypothetical protein
MPDASTTLGTQRPLTLPNHPHGRLLHPAPTIRRTGRTTPPRLPRLATTLLLTLPLLLGMANRKANEIPLPAENYTARVRDRLGIETTVQYTSIEGETILPCRRGAAKLFIRFDKIRKIEFLQPDEDVTPAHIIFRDDAELDVTIDSRLTCYGSTNFGEYAIRVEEIQNLEFLENPTPTPAETDAETP